MKSRLNKCFEKMKFNNFHLQKVLKEGKDSGVYLVHNNGEQCVLKWYKLNIAKERKAIINLKIFRELAVSQIDSHENINQMIGSFEDENKLFCVYSYGEGESLKKYLKSKNETISEEEAIGIFYQILKGIYFLHKNNFIHRDVKPGNVAQFIKNGKNIYKLIDFGMTHQTVYSHTKMIGSPFYLSPEALQSQLYNYKHDLWSLGIIYLEMLEGRTLFNIDEKIEDQEKINQRLEHQILEFNIRKYKFKNQISEESKELLFEILNPNPKHRYNYFDIINMKIFKEFKVIDSVTDNDSFKNLCKMEGYYFSGKINNIDLYKKIKIDQNVMKIGSNKNEEVENFQENNKFKIPEEKKWVRNFQENNIPMSVLEHKIEESYLKNCKSNNSNKKKAYIIKRIELINVDNELFDQIEKKCQDEISLTKLSKKNCYEDELEYNEAQFEIEKAKKKIENSTILLNHQNLTFLRDYFYSDQRKYINLVYHFPEEGTLYDYMKAMDQFSEEQAFILINHILEGLNYLHNVGKVHQNINPQNIFIFKSEEGKIMPKLVGLGLSNTLSQLVPSISDWLAYQAPETFDKDSFIPNYKNDYWSLGVLYYEMVKGIKIWDETSFGHSKAKDFYKTQIISFQPTEIDNESPLSLGSKEFLKRVLDPNIHSRLGYDDFKTLKLYKQYLKKKGAQVEARLEKVEGDPGDEF